MYKSTFFRNNTDMKKDIIYEYLKPLDERESIYKKQKEMER